MRSYFFPFAAAAITLLAVLETPDALAAPSRGSCAGRFIDSLPAVIDSAGTWCLRNNLSTAIASGAAVTIRASDVTIDCNGHLISGLAAGRTSLAQGIYVEFPTALPAGPRTDVTVRGCHLRGFETGIFMEGAGLVEDNRIEGSLFSGIHVTATSTIRRNSVTDTGGSDRNAARAIYARGNSDVLDNVVDGVIARAAPSNDVVGIAVRTNEGGTVRGNRIRGLDTTSGLAIGIQVFPGEDSRGVLIVRNVISGMAAGTGISCPAETGITRENTLFGVVTPVSGCVALGGDEILP